MILQYFTLSSNCTFIPSTKYKSTVALTVQIFHDNLKLYFQLYFHTKYRVETPSTVALSRSYCTVITVPIHVQQYRVQAAHLYRLPQHFVLVGRLGSREDITCHPRKRRARLPTKVKISREAAIHHSALLFLLLLFVVIVAIVATCVGGAAAAAAVRINSRLDCDYLPVASIACRKEEKRKEKTGGAEENENIVRTVAALEKTRTCD